MLKKWLPLVLAATCCVALVFTGKIFTETVHAATAPDQYIWIGEGNFPDKYFREYISDNFDNSPKDGKLSISERELVTTIDLTRDPEVADLKGIHVFTNLEYLDISGTAVTTVDMNNINYLEEFHAADMHLTNIDLTACLCLRVVDIHNNPDLVKFTNFNGIEYNTTIQYLDVSETGLDELWIRNMKELLELYANDCPNLKYITQFSYNTSLEYVDVTNTACMNLWCKDAVSIKTLYCGSDRLENIHLETEYEKEFNLEFLSIKDCPKMKDCYLGNCPNLTDLYIDNVGLEQLVYDFEFGCSTPLKNLSVLNCPNLRAMFVEHNSLENVTVKNCPALTNLTISDQPFEYYEFSNLPKLIVLNLSDTGINSFDFSAFPTLKSITVDYTKLPSLSIPNSLALESLYCEGLPITSLDLSSQTELQYLGCDNTKLTSLDVSKNTKLKRLEARSLPITSLDLIHNPDLQELYLDGTKLSILDLTKNPNIYDVSVADCNLSCLLFNNYCENLTRLYTFGNNLPYLDISSCPILQSLATGIQPTQKTRSNGKVYYSYDSSYGGERYHLDYDAGIELIVFQKSFDEFIERMYVVALDRPSEPEGKAFWLGKVLNEGFTGGRVAIGFLIEAPEFLNRGLTDDQFVEVLYQTFFNRAADADGKAFWIGHLTTDMTREQVVRGFIDSIEWCNLCASYGVKSGATNAKAEKPSKNALMFADRLYTECLGRAPELDGIMFWAKRLTNLESSGAEAAKGFFDSQEFKNLNTTNEEYLTRLYRTFMGREPDADGMTFWLGHLSTDMTREQVLKGFAESQEFTNICAKYGIDRGTL